jgi:addiction module HigA family antidote
MAKTQKRSAKKPAVKKKQSKATPRRGPEPIHPGELVLRNFIYPLNITQGTLSEKLGWQLTRLNKLINGKGGVTAESAIDLARVLGTSPQYWLNLQMEYDLLRARDVKRRDKESPRVLPPRVRRKKRRK